MSAQPRRRSPRSNLRLAASIVILGAFLAACSDGGAVGWGESQVLYELDITELPPEVAFAPRLSANYNEMGVTGDGSSLIYIDGYIDEYFEGPSSLGWEFSVGATDGSAESAWLGGAPIVGSPDGNLMAVKRPGDLGHRRFRELGIAPITAEGATSWQIEADVWKFGFIGWDPDSRHLLYQTGPDPMVVERLDVVTGLSEPLLTVPLLNRDATSGFGLAQLSTDRSQMAYSRRIWDSGWETDIWTWDIDADDPTRVGEFSGSARVLGWSTDASGLFILRDRVTHGDNSPDWELIFLGLPGGSEEAATVLRTWDLGKSNDRGGGIWSSVGPESRQLAITFNGWIFIADAGQSGLRQIPESGGVQINPWWLSSGSIVFEDLQEDVRAIMRIDPAQ